jgi:hypothetical protein
MFPVAKFNLLQLATGNGQRATGNWQLATWQLAAGFQLYSRC